MVKTLAVLVFAVLVIASCDLIPRDAHPERTPSPLPMPVMVVW